MFKVGDKVVCKNNIQAFKKQYLTHNKTYTIMEVLGVGTPGMPIVTIVNDVGELNNEYSFHFRSMDEIRRKKLKKICSKLAIK